LTSFPIYDIIKLIKELEYNSNNMTLPSDAGDIIVADSLTGLKKSSLVMKMLLAVILLSM